MATVAKKGSAKTAAAKNAAVGPTASKKAPAKKAPDRNVAADKERSAKATGRKAIAKKAAVGKAPGKQSAVGKPPVEKASATRSTSPEKDPEGGLTAAGRAAFAARDGSKLKPGVTKPDAEMSAEDMKRKGSWAVRFYGRKSLPPLVDANGEPTRFALSAHAWGEPVPKTEAEARRIADHGRQLLARHAAAAKKAVPTKRASAKKAPKTPD